MLVEHAPTYYTGYMQKCKVVIRETATNTKSVYSKLLMQEV